jgi:hypothetical protein
MDLNKTRRGTGQAVRFASHPERSAAESKDPAEESQDCATGFDSLTRRSVSLWPSRPWRGFRSRSILDFAQTDSRLALPRALFIFSASENPRD